MNKNNSINFENTVILSNLMVRQMVRIKFRCKINEQYFELELDEEQSVSEGKSFICDLSQIEPSCQKWIFMGRVLSDSSTIRETGIKVDNTVHVMRTASNVVTVESQRTHLSSHVPAQDIEMQSVAASSIITSTISVPHFDRAMNELLSNEEAVAKDAVGILHKIVSNIVRNSSEEKYRKVKSTNASFQKKLGLAPGGISCMAAVGFTMVGDEWVLYPSAEAWDILVCCQQKLDRFMSRLNSNTLRPLPIGA